jgi:hypothetical protein
MKRVIAFVPLFISMLLLTSCVDKKANVAPEPDTEIASARDVSHALFCLTDIDMICSYIGEDQFYTNPYTAVNGTITPNRNLIGQYLIYSWYKTACVDGKFREGTVFLKYALDPVHFPQQTPNSLYMREKGFAGRLSLTDYYVDGWKIEIVNDAYIYNALASSDYDPAVTKLTWYIGGKFKFIKESHPDSSMTIDFRINKTLVNSTSKEVFNATKTNKNTNIQWSNGIVAYDGEMNGTTFSGEPFTMTISKQTPLVRDWSCSPDRYLGVAATATPGVFAPTAEQFHPFVKGVATFVPGNKYPRQIFYGNEGDPDLQPQCDNTGMILIKGNSYKVTFYK